MLFLDRLQAKAREWGGDILQVPQDEFKELFGGGILFPPKLGYLQAPFKYATPFGVNYKLRLVYCTTEAPPTPGDIIHEMGHVFASRRSPNQCAEFSFFGWEHAFARHLGIFPEWEKASRFYRITRETCYSELWPDKRQAVLESTLKFAQKRGLVTSDGVPLSIR